jgi:hypothetical protein
VDLDDAAISTVGIRDRVGCWWKSTSRVLYPLASEVKRVVSPLPILSLGQLHPALLVSRPLPGSQIERDQRRSNGFQIRSW